MKVSGAILLFFFSIAAQGQNPVAAFTSLTNACLKQNIFIQNQSTNSSRYEWDLCQGDLNLTPSGSIAGTVAGSNVPTGLDVVFDGSTWYGFIASRDNNSIIRVTLGADLNNFGSITNLGNISSLLNQPIDIKIVSDNSKWYGFVYNQSGNNLICRLDFGSSLTNTPTATSILNSSAQTVNQGLDVIRNNTTWFVAYTFNSQVGILRLPTIETIPDASNQLLTNNLTANPSLGDIKIIEDSNESFYAFTVSYGTQMLYELSFGSNLFSLPTETDYSATLLGSTLNYYGIDAGYDAGYFHLFLTSLQGQFLRIDFGTGLTQPPSNSQNINLGFGGTVKNRLVKNKSSWFIFSTNYSDGSFYQGFFPNPSNCEFPTVLTTENPLITFSTSGTEYVTLTAFSSSGASDESNGSITISSLTSPDIALSSMNNCVNNNVNFNSTNQSGDITNYQWTFGDSSSSTISNPTHIYTTISTYYPSLTVTASNGCQNFVQDTIQIFNPPKASFTLPTASPFCSNQNYVYTNTSIYDNGSNPTWQWSVNETNVATTQNLTYLFPSTNAQSVTLTASIPGCSTDSTLTISTLVDGPLVSFNSPTFGCQSNAISFTNTTSGATTSQSWAFGDGNTSVQSNATNSYSLKGTFPVTLSVTNANGCQNYLTKNIVIYSIPQPAFAVEGPPLSCANYPAQFDNNTSALTDSNITSWAWSFGDAANGTSTQQSPAYTFSAAASYNVSLTATSNFGCTNTTQKAITISPSPNAAFNFTPACVNQNTQFTDASTGTVTLYQWNIQGNTFNTRNPQYIFNASNSYPITLTVTASNGCKSQIVKTITVPIPPTVDFSTQAPCTNTATTFQELYPNGSDPTTIWSWNFGQGSGSGSPVSHQFPATGIYTVTLTTTRQSGCVYSASKNISISTGPTADFTPSVEAGAAPLNVTFNNSSTATSYQWNFGDTNNSTSTATSPTFTYTSLGSYKALLTASNSLGCSDTLSAWINVVIPHIDLVMDNFSLLNNTSSNSSEVIVTISNAGNIPMTNPEIDIDLGGNATVKENLTGTIRPGASYQQTMNVGVVTQYLKYVCVDVEATNDVDLANNKLCETLTGNDVVQSPYPNPAKGQINFDWIASSQENVRVVIYTVTGEIVFEQTFDSVQEGLNQLNINTSSLSNGLYLIQFNGSKTSKTFKIVVAN